MIPKDGDESPAATTSQLEEALHEREEMSGLRSLLNPAVGFGIGVLGLGLIRLVFLPAIEPVHYHANWAMWIDGKRVDFSADRYMEDVAACSADASNITAPQRVHLHENNPDVVHVHHSGATWGHLIQNLGWGIGSDWVLTDERDLHEDGEGQRLTFILNGLFVPPAFNRVILPGDRMLISFGQESTERLLQDQFGSVLSDAPEYDAGYDPAGCQGSAAETQGERVRRALWF